MHKITGRRQPIVRPRLYGLVFLSVIFSLIGCADASAPRSAMETKSTGSAPGEAAPAPARGEPATPPADASKAGTEIPPAAARKIVYTAQATLVVKNVDGFVEKLDALIKEAGGYVSQTDRATTAETQRRATWTVRVPVERFEAFLKSVGWLGELVQSHVDSQDVTMEFYDLEARIANKQQEEKRLLKHLSDSTGKLDDILAVEKEVSRVRGEIEQMQGRIRYLGNVAALSTVTITVTEIPNYVPPLHPTFAQQVARTFHESVEALVGFGKAVVLVAVAVAPWLPLLLASALLIRWSVRRAHRTRRQEPVVLTRTGP